MFKFAAVMSAAVFAVTQATPTDAERALVPEWDQLMTAIDQDYDMYRVETDDEWTLTLFRLTGYDLDPEKGPVFFMHGANMDAHAWVNGQSYATDWTTGTQSLAGPSIMVQLAQAGYDVWMGNNRGSKYSNENSRWPNADNPAAADYLEQNKGKYNTDWFDMGKYDLPAFIDQVLEVSDADKLKYIGYSTGTAELMYGLSQEEESYFADKIERAIFLAPCVYYK